MTLPFGICYEGYILLKSILSGLNRPILFLKATQKKQVWIPPFVKHDGTVVAGHMKYVHVADDHDESKVLAGQGTYSQKKAHAKLSKEAWFNNLPHEHKAPVLMAHATDIQDAESAAARLATFRKNIIAGTQPKGSEWKAYDQASDEKKQEIAAAALESGHMELLTSGYAEYKNSINQQQATQDDQPALPTANYDQIAAQHAEKILATQLPESNINHKSVNIKLNALAELVKNKDIQGILHMSYGTNTYGKKVVALANEALKDLGSEHMVAGGQKKGEHSALGGAGTVAAKPPKAVSAKIAPAPQEPATEDGPLPIKTFEHSKKGHTVFSVSLPAKVTASQFKEVMAIAKQHGGFYSSYKGEGALPGFHFKSDAEAKAFAADAIKHLEAVNPAPQPVNEGATEASPVAAKKQDEPKEGDTKTENGVTYVLKDGRWHKVSAEKPAPKIVGVKVTDAHQGDEVTAVDGWQQTGPQKGYNNGGTFKDEDGQEWYCKFPAGGAKVAKNELLASKLYELAGVAAAQCKLISKDGKVGIASKIIDGVKESKEALLAGKAKGLLSGFAVDAWLANWDTVGNNPAKGFDNILIAPDGSAVRIDAGGALQYGGAGGKKQAFGKEVIELKTMLDPEKNANTAAVFNKLTPHDIAASVKKVAIIPDADIINLVKKYGPGNAAENEKLADLLIARKADMIKQYPSVATGNAAAGEKAKKKIVFDPSKLGQVPDFLNWKGVGQSGPATLHDKNVANQEAVNKLLEVAKSGSIEAIKNLQMPFYDKHGTVTHTIAALDHPSQHVKGYAQQLINEIEIQLHPPRPFRWSGNSPLAALDVSYPKVKNISAGGLNKLGYYIKLGKPGTLSNEVAGIHQKLSWKAGTLKRSTYKKAAQAVTAKLPKQQKDALKSYTGSGYQQINKSLWSGNPDGAAKSAEEALLTLGHEVIPGTILSRKINISGADLDALKKSAGLILQEPAVMSTSLRPSCWNGNVHFKMTVGPGVKGLYVGTGSMADGSALSLHSGEDELILPPNTRMLVQAVKASEPGGDEDGFGETSVWTVEVLILPTN